MGTKLSIEIISADQLEKHLGMLNLSFDPWGTPVEWRYKYLRPGFDAGAMLVVKEDGNWVGGATLWPASVLVNGQKVKAFVPGDLYTHPDHTGKGVYSAAMKCANQRARQDGAALGIAFVSRHELPFVALPGYGYRPVFSPETRIKILNPEKIITVLENKRINLLGMFENKKIKMTVGKKDFVFVVKDSRLRPTGDNEADTTVKADWQTLFGLFFGLSRGKPALILTVLRMVLSRKLVIKMPFKGWWGVVRGIVHA
ncbi:MAG: GNAT family N-acetyltransferase [Chloroflexi bacterium]|nr:GNAT family N-acetyltransferase [Chloroflexota bacterium]